MGLEMVLKYIRKPKIVASTLLISMGLSIGLPYAGSKIDEKYVQAGGDPNVYASNHEKVSYILYRDKH